jgi:hypothetical protein
MNNNKATGSIEMPKTKRQWKLYQQIGTFAQDLNRLPDAQEIRKSKPQSAPIALLPMVF